MDETIYDSLSSSRDEDDEFLREYTDWDGGDSDEVDDDEPSLDELMVDPSYQMN